MEESTHGLNCPNCGGVVPIPEGQIIVRCTYCDMRSFVRGERGLLRYQAPLRIQRDNAIDAMRKFFGSKWAMARNLRKEAKLSEAFLVYLPFWTVWSRVAAWVFGEEKIGSGDRAHYEPREIRVVQEMTWNEAACDVGEFGVSQVPPVEERLEPFDPDELHRLGLVFEPVSSFSEARRTAQSEFEAYVRVKAKLDRMTQLFLRSLKGRFGLVYHPLWVLRYLYRGRAFQVTVDGFTGEVLYGKAPGNTFYRAGVLVLGMAVGAFVAITVPILSFGEGKGSCMGPIFFIIVGLLIIGSAYRVFRYGEQYEYRHGAKKRFPGLSAKGKPQRTSIDVTDVEEWIDLLN